MDTYVIKGLKRKQYPTPHRVASSTSKISDSLDGVFRFNSLQFPEFSLAFDRFDNLLRTAAVLR